MSIAYTPRTWVAGDILTAAQLNAEVRDPFTGVQAAWTTFTSTLTAATTNPTGQASSSAFGRLGGTMLVRIFFTLAATNGTGAYSVTVPLSTHAGVIQAMEGFITDTGVGDARLSAKFSGSTIGTLLVDPTTAGAFLRAATSAVPVTLGSGDTIALSGVYET